MAALWALFIAWLAPRWAALLVQAVPAATVSLLLLIEWFSGDTWTKLGTGLLVFNVVLLVLQVIGKLPALPKT